MLESELSKFYTKQGRGRFCHVDKYLRQDPQRHCYFAYPEDYASTDMGYSTKGEFQRHRPRRSAFELIFAYRPEDGFLELSAHGNKEQKNTLANIFCKTILGLDDPPDNGDKGKYNLSILKNRGFPFTTDPADGVESVEVRQLILDLNGKNTKRITLSSNGEDGLYDLMDEALNQNSVSVVHARVSGGRLRFTFSPNGSSRARTLTFEIGCPDRCTLKDDKHDQIAKKYLSLWGIVNA